jgi:PAS domain S-box-containing protein
MTKRRAKAPSAAELRRLAEERLRAQHQGSPRARAPQDQDRLNHELQVHQIELELQNEELRRVGEELEATLARYRELYDFAPVGYVTLDDASNILEINLAGAALIGKERARAVGQSFARCVAVESRPAFDAFLGKLREGADEASCDVAVATPGDHHMHVHIVAVRELTGNAWRCRAAMTDVTRRDEVEETLRRQRARLASSYELTSALSSAPTIADVARVVFEKGLGVFGADAGALALADGQDEGMLRIVAHFGYPDEVIEAWRRFPAALAAPVTDAYRTGVVVWVESTVAAMARYPEWAPAVARGADRAWAGLPLRTEGRTFGALGLAFRRARSLDDEERALMQSVADRCAQALDRARLLEAEREARVRAQASEEGERRARQEAERIGELQRLTLGVVAHDLRTPLQSIRMSADVLLRGGDLDPAQAESALRIARGADRIGGIIRDLLDYTRARQGETLQIERRQVDLDELCRAIVLETRSVHPDRDISFESSGECPGAWDPVRVGQAVSNLLSNALQHGGGASRVRVSLAAEEAAATITVFNEGPPIPPEVQQSIFQPYRRGDAGEGKARRGLGLGLFIVREIARAHGGEVSLESTGSGTSFAVRLPRLRIPEARVDLPQPPAGGAAR